MSLSTFQNVALVEVESIGRGMQIETYDCRLQMVLSLMNSGSIAGPKHSGYGSLGHRLALRKIEQQLVKVRQCIQKHNAEEGL